MPTDSLQRVVPTAIAKLLRIGLNHIRSQSTTFYDPYRKVKVPAVKYTLQIPIEDVKLPLVVYLMSDGVDSIISDGVSFHVTTKSIAGALKVLKSKVDLLRSMH